MRILIAAVFYAWLSSIPCGSRGRAGRPGGCGTRRLARGGDRLQYRPRSAFPLAHRGGRSPRALHRRLGKSHAHIGPERTTSWAGFVLTLFPRAMLIMAAAFKHGFHKE